jgi:hypothetical protein
VDKVFRTFNKLLYLLALLLFSVPNLAKLMRIFSRTWRPGR